MRRESARRRSEQRLLELVSELLTEYQEPFARVGLRPGEIHVERWDEPSVQRSEISISLLKGSKFFDVVELFAWDDGLAFTVETAEAGIREDFDNAIERCRG